ncbi:MAG: oxidoreductase [Bryobacterales bacterium]|nr:oxidoreductase [Bryobacterales bacterium]
MACAVMWGQKGTGGKTAGGTKTGETKAGGTKGVSAFNKPVFEAYIRHLFVWPPPVQIDIDDPKPGPMPGYDEVTVRASQGNASSTETFYVSKDGQKIVRGQIFDIAKNPFKSDLDKLKTEFRPSMGTAGAPVVIVAFSDFQCHYCKEEAKTLRENLLKDYPTQVRLYFMDNPLDSVHPWARAAADAGQCIFKQKPGVFWDYHDWIFEHQEEITPENLQAKVLDFAKGKELDALALGRCMDTKATDGDVQKSVDEGKAVGVSSTPTIFVNGRKLVGAVDWPSLKRIIDYEIDYQKTAKNAGEDCGCEVTLPTPGFK